MATATPEGQDFDDFGRRFGDDAVREAIDGARQYVDDGYWEAVEAEAAQQQTDDVETQPDPIGEMVAVASTAGEEPPPRRWIVDKLIPVGAVTTLFGDGGVGKTLAAMQIGVAVERGAPIFGFETTASPVLGFFCEDEQAELERRFHSICRTAGLGQDQVEGFLYQSRFGRESLLGAFDELGAFAASPLLDAIGKMAKAKQARLIVLDNILHLYNGNINDPGEVTRFLAALNRLALAIDGAILLLGHVAKTQGSQFSGTMAWSNASRSRLFMGRPGDLDRFAKLGEEDGGGRDLDERILARLKANYAPISEPMTLRYFEGAFVRPDELPENFAAEMAAIAAENAHNDRFLACLREMTRQHRAVSEKPSSTYAPKVFTGLAEAKGSKKAHLVAAMDRLFRTGKIERAELWKGPDRKPVFGLRETAGDRSAPHAGESEEMAENCAK